MRKYQFKDRAEAEAEYRRVDRERLRAEWVFTGLLNKTLRQTGRIGTRRIGYLLLPHSTLIYSYHVRESIHCGIDTWDVDSEQLQNVITGLFRTVDNESYGLGRQLEIARQTALRELSVSA
jgi:hypothetical protein